MGLNWLLRSAAAVLVSFMIAKAFRWVMKQQKSAEAEVVAEFDGTAEADATNEVRPQKSFWMIGRYVFVSALSKPLLAFLPWATVSLIWEDGTKTLHHAYTYWQAHKRAFPSWFPDWFKKLLPQVAAYDASFRLYYDIALVIFGAWLLNGMKNTLVELWLQSRMSKESNVQIEELQRVVIPFSSLGTWIITTGTLIVCLGMAGINIQPLLGLGGLSAALIGLSGQSVFANLIAGINLFISRPFVPGERICLYNISGVQVLTGTVARIEPLRTVITDDDIGYHHLPNKTLQDMHVCNESRMAYGRTSSVNAIGNRRLKIQLACGMPDDQLEDVTKELERQLTAMPGVDSRALCLVEVESFADGKYKMMLTMAAVKQIARSRKHYAVFKRRAVRRALEVLTCEKCVNISATIS